MKTFVTTGVFNSFYEDLGWIDYYTVTKITEKEIFMIFYTKKEISKESIEFDTLVLRNINLGEQLGKEIVWDYKPTVTNRFYMWFVNLITKYNCRRLKESNIERSDEDA